MTEVQDPRSIKGGPNRDLSWYLPTIPKQNFPESTKKMLREYSRIPDDQIEKHICELRDKAWEVFPYASIGRFTFLQLSIGDSPQYKEVLRRVKGGEKLIDLGCSFGQDLRKLVYDGAPSENLYGSDVAEEFFTLGYELFKDRETLKSQFIVADALAEENDLQQLNGTLSMIHASSIFHLFDRPTQVKLGVHCVALLQRKPGATIFGRQGGRINAGLVDNPIAKAYGGDAQLFHQSPESWKEMWDEIGSLTGTSWDVEAYLYPDEVTRTGTRMRYTVRML